MIVKTIEIRDRHTFIPTLVILVEDENEAQRYYMKRSGYPTRNSDGCPVVVMMRMSDQRAHSDPYDWDDRTHRAAHNWLQEQVALNGRDWFRLHPACDDGAVIDVEFILGETENPKRSEREEHPL